MAHGGRAARSVAALPPVALNKRGAKKSHREWQALARSNSNGDVYIVALSLVNGKGAGMTVSYRSDAGMTSTLYRRYHAIMWKCNAVTIVVSYRRRTNVYLGRRHPFGACCSGAACSLYLVLTRIK